MVASEVAPRIAVIAMQTHPSQNTVSRLKNIVVVRLPASKRRGSAIRYLFEYFWFLGRSWLLIRRDRRFRTARVVHVHSLPDFLIAAARPARARGARILLDLHEILPEFTRSKFPGLAGRVGEFIARRVEKWSRRQATVTITVNHPVEELLRSRPAVPHERIVVIHNVPDDHEMGPARTPTGEVHDPLRLVYHGTITPLYGLDIAVAAVIESLAQHRIKFDIYGNGPARKAVHRLIEESRVRESVALAGIIRHQDLRHRLTQYDAGLLGTRADGMTQYSLSTKLLEYVHLGLPVIAPHLPAYERYFPAPALWYFSPNDSADASRAISEFLAASRTERRDRAAAAQQTLHSLRWSAEAARLAGLYRELLDHPR